MFELGRGYQHKSRQVASSSAKKDCGPVFQTTLVVNEKVGQPPGLKLVRHKNSERRRRWRVNEAAEGSLFPIGDQGSLRVTKVLSHLDVKVEWIAQNSFKTALGAVLALAAKLHHTEAIVDVGEGKDSPIRVFIEA